MSNDALGYVEALRELSISSLIKNTSDVAKEEITKDALFKSIFYRVDNKKEVYTETTTKNRESELEEYLCALNTKDTLQYIHCKDLYNAEINGILEVRKRLFRNVLGKYSYPKLRRYTNSCGTFVTMHQNEVEDTIEKLAIKLNAAPKNVESSFVSAVNYLLEMMKLHPVEEGDGRVGRLVTNSYLLQRGIKPIWLGDNRNQLISIAEAYCFSGYLGSTLGMIIGGYAKESGDKTFIKRISILKSNNPYTNELRDMIMLYSGEANEAEISKDIMSFRELGNKDTHFAHAALWLISVTGEHKELLNTIYSEGKASTKALATLVMENVDIVKHQELIRTGLNNKSYLVRMASVGVLGRNKLINNALFRQIADEEMSNRVLGALGRIGRYMPPDKENLETLLKLTKHPDDNVKIGAYYGLVRIAKSSKVFEVIEAKTFDSLRPIVKKAIIEEISNSEKLNDEWIAHGIVGIVSKERDLRHIVLGELSRKSRVSLEYRNMLFKTMKSGSGAEKAYALYLYGKNFGVVSTPKSSMNISERMSFALLTAESTGNNTLKRSSTNTERRMNFDLILNIQYDGGPANRFREYDATNKFCTVLNEFATDNISRGNDTKVSSIKNSLRKESTGTKIIMNK